MSARDDPSLPPSGRDPELHAQPAELRPDKGGQEIRVLLIDDDPGIRTLTTLLLRRADGIELTGAAHDSDAGLAMAVEHQPDVVLLDLLMPRREGREILPDLVRRCPRAMVVILSALSATDEAETTFELGAFAYLEKSVLGPKLGDEIRDLHELFLKALAGETVWAPRGPSRIRR